MSLPRQSVNNIEYNGINIPAGTTFHMNALAGDYDEQHFKDPYTFNLERYLGDVNGTPHYAYEAGSRMCAGSNLGNRELYIFFTRLISAVRILPSSNNEDTLALNVAECNTCTTALAVQPKMFKCRFQVRNQKDLDSWMENSRSRAKNH